MGLAGKGTTLLLESVVLIYIFVALINDMYDQTQAVNDSITGSVLIKSVLVLVLIIAVVMQIFNASGLTK